MKVSHSLKRLLTSHTRLKLLNTLFYAPDNLFYVRELVRLSGEEINSVRRELLNLETAGIVAKEVRGNRLYYWADPRHYLFYDLVIIANQHSGLGSSLQEHHLRLGKLKAVLYSQDFLRHSPSTGSSVDILIIGDISLRLVDDLIKSEQERLGREINYMVMDLSELRLRVSKRDPILVDFFVKFPAIIIGNPAELNK